MLTGLLIVACGKADADTATGGGTETDSSGTSDDPTTTDPSAGSNSGGQSCTPGASTACTCTSGESGAQVCAADGKSLEPCVCEGGGSVSNSDSNSTTPTTDPPATTSGPEMTSGPVMTTDVEMTTGVEMTTTTGDIECVDPGPEPNEEEGDAVDLGDQTCQADDGMLSGVLSGAADVDWFTYRGVDGMGCGFNNPFAAHTLTASDTVRLCVFAECEQGVAMFMCPMGSQANDSPGNRPGCCGDGDLTFQFNCSMSQNETADFYVRVDQAPDGACVDYSLTYSFGPMG